MISNTIIYKLFSQKKKKNLQTQCSKSCSSYGPMALLKIILLQSHIVISSTTLTSLSNY